MAGPQDVALEEVFWRSPQHLQVMGGYLHSNNSVEADFLEKGTNACFTNSNHSSFLLCGVSILRCHLQQRLACRASKLQWCLSPFRGDAGSVRKQTSDNARIRVYGCIRSPTGSCPVGGCVLAGTIQYLGCSQADAAKTPRHGRWGHCSRDLLCCGGLYIHGTVCCERCWESSGKALLCTWNVTSRAKSLQLSVVASVTKLLNTASPLPIFSPSYGHTYMPPIPKALDSLSQPSSQSQQSKEATPMPDIQAQAKASLAGTSTNFSSNEDTRNLTEALALLSKYGDEFMDETPLVGEPGSFIFSKASDAPSSTRQVSRTNAPVPGSSGPAKAETASSVGRLTKTAEKEKLLSDSTDSQDLLKRKRSRAEIWRYLCES